MIKISGVILTFNEARNISRCIESVLQVADEIVVVDSFSTDATPDICKSYRARLIKNPCGGYIDQKNFALSRACFDVVLSLDADEELSTELIHWDYYCRYDCQISLPSITEII